MFPAEMVILMAIAATRDGGKELITRPTDVIGEYIGYLYDSLVRRGYIKGNSSRGYQLTSKGSDVLSEFLCENKTRVKETIIRLQQIGIKISQEQKQKLDKLAKEVIKVN